MRDFLPADLEPRVQRERAVTQLSHAYALVCQLGDMDATRVDEFVGTLIEAGAVEHIDAVLEHLDVAAGAWRQLADLADCVTEGVAASLTRVVLARAATVALGTA